MKGKFTYFFDPLCGWCYGFSDSLSQFYENHKHEYEFEVIPGGMIRGAMVGPIESKREIIKGSYQRIEEMSGVTFGEMFLKRTDEGSTILDSDPPTKAFHAIKKLGNTSDVLVAKAIQKAIYFTGIDPNSAQAFATLATEFGINQSDFIEAFHSKDIEDEMHQYYYTAQQFQVQSFPYMIMETEGAYYLISQGFRTSEDLEDVLQKALDYHKEKKR